MAHGSERERCGVLTVNLINTRVDQNEPNSRLRPGVPVCLFFYFGTWFIKFAPSWGVPALPMEVEIRIPAIVEARPRLSVRVVVRLESNAVGRARVRLLTVFFLCEYYHRGGGTMGHTI